MFSAYYLLRDGNEVTVVDKTQHGLTSTNNLGLLTPQVAPVPHLSYGEILRALSPNSGPLHISPSEIFKNPLWFTSALSEPKPSATKALYELGLRSLELFKEFLFREEIDAAATNGVCIIYQSENEAKELIRKFGGKFLDSQALADLGYINLKAGVMFEDDMAVDPSRLFYGLKRKLLELGAKFQIGKPASFSRSAAGELTLHFGNSELIADDYVVAAGSATANILRPLHYNPAIIPARGHTLIFTTCKTTLVSVPAIISTENFAVSQHGYIFRAASFFEFVGHSTERLSDQKRAWLLNTLKSYIRGVDRLEEINEVYGFRPCTPNQMPLVGKVPGFDNLFVASGGGMIGFTLAPAIGETISNMINGGR